jgi:hypothetical protein
MAITYSNDILRLFTPSDIQCMAGRQPPQLLGDQNWMCNPAPANGFADHGNARHVHQRLADGTMPPGRPWSDANVQVYEDWMSQGFQK